MDWSLLGCGARGHVTYAPDEPHLRERLSVPAAGGPAWRCLRCGTFVAGQPTAAGPAHAAPRVRRGKELRSALILRAFAVERFLRGLIFAVLAVAVWRFASSRLSVEEAFNRELPAVRSLLRGFGYHIDHSKLLGLIHSAFRLDSRTLTWLALGCAGYAVIEFIEAAGLWLGRRWGEYFAMVATSVGIPYEIYDLIVKVTALRLVAFAINVALVAYLVITKRLLGVRGGKKAYEARLRTDSIMEIESAAAAEAKAAAAAHATTSANPPAPAAKVTAPGATHTPAADP